MSRQPKKKVKRDESSSSSSQDEDGGGDECQVVLKHLLGQSDILAASKDSLLSWFLQPSYLDDVGGGDQQIVTAFSEGHDDEYTKFWLQYYADGDTEKSSILYLLRYAQVKGKDKFPLAPVKEGLVAIDVPIPVEPAVNNNQESEKAMECCICLQIMRNPCSLVCGHSGCLKCMQDYFKGVSKKCPKCRNVITLDNVKALAPNVALRDAISFMFPHLAKEREMEDELDMWEESCKSLCIGIPARAPAETRKLAKGRIFDVPKLRGKGSLKKLSDFSLRRLCRCAGILLEDQSTVYDEIRKESDDFITAVVKRLQFSKTDTVIVDDVLKVLNDASSCTALRHCAVYGFGGPYGTRHLFSSGILYVLDQVHPELTIDPTALSVINDLLAYLMFSLHEHAASSAPVGTKHVGIVTRPAGPIRELDGDGDEEEYEFFNTHNITLYLGIQDILQLNIHPIQCSPAPVIDVKVLETVLPQCLMVGELPIHANNEGQKAVESLRGKLDANSPLARLSGLVFDPEHVIRMIHACFPSKGNYFIQAAVYLTAVLEFICVEILELAGYETKDLKMHEISARHILLGIRKDGELDALFPGAIREGGYLREDPPLQRCFVDASEEEELKKEDEAITKMLLDRARDTAEKEGKRHVLGIDPRTGLHFSYDQEANPEAEFAILNPCPVADTMCAVSRHERKKVAARASRTIVRLNENDEIHAHDSNRESASSSSDFTVETLKKMKNIRLNEFRFERRNGSLIIPPVEFARHVVSVIAENARPEHPVAITKWTREALDALQTALEHHLIIVCKKARVLAIHADRRVVVQKDVQLARDMVGQLI